MSSIAKRTRSQYQLDQPKKRFKFDPNGVKEGRRRTTSIIDLNDDCLVKVFLYLSQNDLINVCVTNSRFRLASERAFIQNYAKLQINVSTIRHNRANAGVLKNSMRLLKTFAHLIRKLLVEFKLENVAKILELVDKNCGENLNELELCQFGATKNQRHNTGLEEVNSFLGGLSKRFPNLHHLKLEYRNPSKMSNHFNSLVQPIPSLKSFSFAMALLSLADIREFIRLNGQLECVALIGLNKGDWMHPSLQIPQEFISYMDKALPQLEDVEICRINIQVRNPFRRLQRFQNLKRFTIGNFTGFTAFGRDQLSFAGENIEEICAYFHIIHYSHLRNFAGKMSQFKKLERLVLHLMISKELYNAPTTVVWLLEDSLHFISDNNQFTEVVILLYNEDSNCKPLALTDVRYLNSIKSEFNMVQWRVDEDRNRLVFSRYHQN